MFISQHANYTNKPDSNINKQKIDIDNKQIQSNKIILINPSSKQSIVSENINKNLIGDNQYNKNIQKINKNKESIINPKKQPISKQIYQTEDSNSYNDYYNDPNYLPEEDEISEEIFGNQIRNRSLRIHEKTNSVDKIKVEKNKIPMKISIQGGKIEYNQKNNNSMIERFSKKNISNKRDIDESFNTLNRLDKDQNERNLNKKSSINKKTSIKQVKNNEFQNENNKIIKGKKMIKAKQAYNNGEDLKNQPENPDMQKPIKLKFDMNKCKKNIFLKMYFHKI